MTQEELKKMNEDMDTRAKALVSGLQLEGNERSVVVSLQKGNTFKLAGMNKVELQQTRNSQTKFVPIVFITDGGATIGAKHFSGIDFGDDEAPTVGGTPLENAKFLVWCQAHQVVFSVSRVTSEDVEARGDVPAYTRKTYALTVKSFLNDTDLTTEEQE